MNHFSVEYWFTTTTTMYLRDELAWLECHIMSDLEVFSPKCGKYVGFLIGFDWEWAFGGAGEGVSFLGSK